MQGLLLLNKPENKTSFSAVAAIKRLAGEKRVGHTGTLDPMATGVLPVLLGRATALSNLLLDADKRYTAGIKLGVTTDTEDITGTVISENAVNITNEQLQGAVMHFTGVINQRPPIYSALKKDGVRLYKLAREGKSVDIPERQIEIFSSLLIKPIDNENTFLLDVHVSKGTYIRSLARDIGEYLGCGATLCSLSRTYAGGFNLSECVSLEELTPENISSYIYDEEKAVGYLREIDVTDKQAIRFCNGGQLDFERLRIDNLNDGELFRIKSNGVFLGIGFADLVASHIGIKCIINYPKGNGK